MNATPISLRVAGKLREVISVAGELWEVVSREPVIGYSKRADGSEFEYRYTALMAKPMRVRK